MFTFQTLTVGSRRNLTTYRVLESEGVRRQTFTDSRYAFATLHVHGALYKEKGLLTANRKDIKNKEEILTLLDAVWEPER